MHEPDYKLLQSQLTALLRDEDDALANASNFVALMNLAMDDINWLGIYVLRENELVLGPFQGQPACVRIPLGKGVCGAAAISLQSQRVEDVRKFPGHIVCDAASRSELVVPLLINDELVGVLDIDSPIVGRFSAADQAGVEAICAAYCETLSGQPRFI